MFQALVTQPPALYLAIIAGALLIALIQQLALSARRGTVKSLETEIANREYVVERQAVNIRALNLSNRNHEAALTESRQKAGKLMIALTNAAVAACKAADERARAFVETRTDEAIKAIVAAEHALKELTEERDEAIAERDEALAALGRRGESGTVAEADFNEAAGEALRAETATETGTRVHQTLDDVLFGGTPFKASADGPDVVPVRAVFTLDANGVAVPQNGAAKFLANKLGADFFTKLAQRQAAQAGTDDESCSTFARPTVSLDDLKAALTARGERNGRPNGRSADH